MKSFQKPSLLIFLTSTLITLFFTLPTSNAFTPSSPTTSTTFLQTTTNLYSSPSDDTFLQQETSAQTQSRIQSLVDTHPVLLFMKGSKIFPQCGFSSTAVQILNTFNINFHSVDVLSDENIRQGVKTYSQWPTIPQLYVAGEFIGGCDIMIEMYQSGELGEMIEKARADMV